MLHLLRFLFATGALLLFAGSSLAQQGDELLGPEERAEVDLMRRRGEVREAREILDEILAEDPDDAALLVMRARCRFEQCDYDGAVEDVRRALALQEERADTTEDIAPRAEALRELARILVELGRAPEAVAALEAGASALRPASEPRDAWILGRALLEVGRRRDALGTFRQGAEAEGERTWRTLLAQARCQRALGLMEQAAVTLVAGDRLAAEGEGPEPDLLVELGSLYFEAYGEVDDPVSRAHSPAELYREVLVLHPEHEGARRGMFELYRFNWRRSRTTPAEILDAIFAARPRSIDGLVARASAALDDGALLAARRDLATLEELAPNRRDVRVQAATLAWVENRRDDARAILDELLAADPGDSAPERELGRHLLELYRFAEAEPFLRSAVERDGRDWEAWRELGRAQANTGDEEGARESLAKAVAVAEGRHDAWRDNTSLVLRRMAENMVEVEHEELSFAWLPDAAAVLEAYLVPFYAQAREELAARYGYTPGPTKIEVFRRWGDFSVRSTGFEGFPALGVCFGPVVTAVSPLSELRGNFSWARTSYHEFTHVIHLGLSHNRCPRWVTEGLATWEESQRNPAWKRNLRREMIDARANGTIIPIRQLNGAFRGSRVVFAYYQSSLLCALLIEEHGFAPMVRLLEAFDAGADLDQAFRDQFDVTPEEMDARLLEHVDREYASLAIEPRWSPENTFRLRFRLSRRPPEDPGERAAWIEDWCTVGWGYYGEGKGVDAEEALRTAETAGALPPRGLFLRAEMTIERDEDAARALYEQAFAAGGEDFRARIAHAALLQKAGDEEGTERELLAAQSDFPGFDEAALSAEIRLAALYEEQGRTADAMAARMRWLAFNAGEYELRVVVARWLAGEDRHAESVRYWREANEVDPFRRSLHLGWGRSLRALGRHEEALREFEVGQLVPAELDGDLLETSGIDPELPIDPALPEGYALGLWEALESELLGLQALTLRDLDRLDEARAAAERALELDPECEAAREVLGDG